MRVIVRYIIFECFFFFFNDTATTEIYTLSLHDALPILDWAAAEGWNPGLRDADAFWAADPDGFMLAELGADRKSTRLNSSHANISYAVFCLKKKKHKPSSPIVPTTLCAVWSSLYNVSSQ